MCFARCPHTPPPARNTRLVVRTQYVKQAHKPGRSYYVAEEIDHMKRERDAARVKELLRSECCRARARAARRS